METALIILVTLIVILAFTGENLVSFIRKIKLKKQNKAQEQQDAEQKKQAEIAAWQAELHEKANEKRRLERERKARIAEEGAAKCATLSGFLSERQDFYITAISKVNAYVITSANRRLKPNERTEQIIWESLEIIFKSQNAKTIQSRIALIQDCTAKLIYPPIDEHMIRIIATHYYLVQIATLEEKIANYKTQAAKNKAQNKIEELFEQALNNNAVYHQVILECKQLVKNEKKP